MAVTPKFKGPDGVLRESYVFTTSVRDRFFTGTTDADTADMLVSIRGGSFTSDPNYIFFEGTTFTVPNPSAFPNGLALLPGDNKIEIKAVLTNGQTTAVGKVEAKLSTDRDVGTIATAPTGIFVERKDKTVKITVDGIDDPEVVGYHFYATTAPGGGAVGYNRITADMVSSAEVVEVASSIAELTVDAKVAKNVDGTHKADPQYMVFAADQKDKNDTILQADFSQKVEIPETADNLKTVITMTSLRDTNRFSFEHDRQATFSSAVNPAIPNAEFNTIPTTDPLYYVATAVYVIDGDELESDFSPEVAGSPLKLTATVGSFPTVTRQQMVREAAITIYRAFPQLDIKPGSATRDTFIDPFTNEAERLRFVMHFLHDAQSFMTLLAIDDPDLTGISIPVQESSYKLALKQAFYLADNASVQALIDNCFDKLAARTGVTRSGGNRSRGVVSFSVSARPTSTITFPIGTVVTGGGLRFRTTSTGQITSSGAGSTFDPSTGRYTTSVTIQAEDAGKAGNLGPGQVRDAEVQVTGLQVTNPARLYGGQDEQSNYELALEAQQGLASVDSGTAQGIKRKAQKLVGVGQVNIVEAGHPLMQRDIKSDGTHTGGKVDVWVKGENLATVTDAFAFTFETKKDIHFVPVGDPQSLKFRAVDTDLSDKNPIIEVLAFADFNYKFQNLTQGYDFDTTGATIIQPDIVQLSKANNDPSKVSLGDIITGTYRYRTSNKHVFTRQPVVSIGSFKGDPSQSGTVSPSLYKLFRSQSPLALGRSSEGGDYLQVVQPTSGVTVAIPSGAPLTVTQEQHVILDTTEYLNSLGAVPETIQVFNSTGLTEYNSPFKAGSDPDYTIILGTATTPVGIKLTEASNIKSGDTILISYKHDENFTVEYDTNFLVGSVASEIEASRHVTGNMVAKAALPVPVDITGTIVLRKGAAASTVDAEVRTELARLFNPLFMGEPVRQSDVIEAIDAVGDVSYVVVPLVKMARGDNAVVVREAITTDVDADSTKITAWSTATVDTYLIHDALASATSHAGGPDNEFRGVFQDELRLFHQEDAPNVNGVPIREVADGAFIIGSVGLDIPGYSDDATLKAKYPFATDAEIVTHRKTLTANRVLVALKTGDTPTKHDYKVTYIVSGDTGAKDIVPGAAEYLTVGDLDFSYDEDTDFQSVALGTA